MLPGPPPILDHRLDDRALVARFAALKLAPPAGGTLSADQATIVALHFSPRLAAVAATAVRTRADAEVAAQRANPVVSFTPDRVISAAAGSLPWTVALLAALPLLYPGQQAARERVRAATGEAVRLDVAQAGWQARSAAVAALRAVAVTRAAQSTAEGVAAKNAERLAASDRLFAAHQTGRAERALVLEATARAAADLPVRSGARSAAEAQLAAALGLPPGEADKLHPALPGWDAPPAPAQLTADKTAATLQDKALFNRLDVQALLARLRIADASYGEIVAGARPELTLTPGYTYDRGDHRLQFGLDVAVPVFHGTAARVQAARAARTEALANMELLQASVIGDVAARFADYSARYAAFATFGPILGVGEAEVARARRELAAGSGDRPALLDAEGRLLAAQLARLDALAALQAAAAALEDAIQQPLWPVSQLADTAQLVVEAQ